MLFVSVTEAPQIILMKFRCVFRFNLAGVFIDINLSFSNLQHKVKKIEMMTLLTSASAVV